MKSFCGKKVWKVCDEVKFQFGKFVGEVEKQFLVSSLKIAE
jgi:hypothetical protein